MAIKKIVIGIFALVLATTPLVAQQKAGAGPDARQPGGPSLENEPGVLVVGVETDSPALKTGLARGTIILEVDGTAVNDAGVLRKAIESRKPGDSMSLKVRFGETEKTLKAVLGSRGDGAWLGVFLDTNGMPPTGGPDGNPGPGGPGMDRGDNHGFRGPDCGGMAMGRDMPGRGGGRFEGNREPGGQPRQPPMMPGCLVVKAVPGSPAEKAGLKAGDAILAVDGTRIDARQDIASLIASRKAGDAVSLSVLSQGQAPRDVKVTLAKDPGKDGPFLGIEIAPQPPAPDGAGRPATGPGGPMGSI